MTPRHGLAALQVRIALLLLLAGSAPACGREPAQASPPPATHTVTIESMRFSPATLTVRPGDTVRWVNKDMFAHTATAAGVFDSGEIAPGQSWARTWPATPGAGEVPYLCTYHPPMTGVIRVEER